MRVRGPRHRKAPGIPPPAAALLAPLLALLTAAPAGALEITGRLQQELAWRVSDGRGVTKGLSFVQLEGARPLGSRARLTLIGRAWYDPVLDLRDPTELNPRLGPGDAYKASFVGAELKEAYLDVLTEAVDLRLGRQIVRWGVLEGARITDRVNPLDFREFVFRDVEDRYIPLWMVRANAYPGPVLVQVLVIPDMTFHKPAPPGSEWEEFQLPPDIRTPSVSPKHTEYGLLVGGRAGETDLTASYRYTWDDFPAAFRSVFGVGGQPTGVDFAARYERLHVFGVTATRTLRRTVGSFEAAYDRGKHLATDPGTLPASGDEIARDVARWGAGLDVNLEGVDVSLLYFQEHVIGWKPFIPVERIERAASLLVRDEFLGNRLEVRLLTLYFHTGRQYIVRPRVAYRWTDHVKLAAGLDLLGGKRGSAPGDPDGVRDFRFVGYLKDHDRVDMALSYRF